MDAIRVLKLEHQELERELFELDAIMEGDVINYPNLLHVFRRLCELWDPHEEREELVFGVRMCPAMTSEKVKTNTSANGRINLFDSIISLVYLGCFGL